MKAEAAAGGTAGEIEVSPDATSHKKSLRLYFISRVDVPVKEET